MGADLLLVGRVARPHGIRGQVVVNPESDFVEDRFKGGQTLLIGPAGAAKPYGIREVRFHQGRPIVSLSGVETMNDAEMLAGAEIWLPESAVGPLPDGTFYRHDLVGCEVRDMNGAVLGIVTGVEGSLERSYLVVDEHMMIPLVGGICEAIDVKARRITVNPPDGLADLNRPSGAPGRS